MKTHQKESKDTRPSKLDSLPYDLQMAIVTRLPAKSLMKLGCVSKMWSSIIRSRECIDSFYSVSSTQSRFIVAVSNCTFNNNSEKRRIFCFSFSDVGKSSSLVPKFEMTIPSESFIAPSGYCESLHGFLSVTAGYRQMICNPVTKQVIKFPICTRFVGYDPIDDQHKALYAKYSYDSDHVEHKVLTLGGGQGWRRIEGTDPPSKAVSEGVCINGFVYYGAYSSRRPLNPGVVCFDVRSEKLSYIKAPDDVVFYGMDSILLEYKGKLASIVRFPYDRVTSFDLWILEDVEKHEWSKQTCVFPLSLWDFVGTICFSGTTKTGEIIMYPHLLSLQVRPFYIFYFNVETKTIRRVRLLGIGDNEEFRRCCGIAGSSKIHVRIAPRHVESISRIPI